MKVLKLDLERFNLGFKSVEVNDPYIYWSDHDKEKIENIKRSTERYINNNYLDYLKPVEESNGITELQKIQFLLIGTTIYARKQESRINPYIRLYLKSYMESFKDDLERFKKGENIEDEILFTLYYLYKEESDFFDNNKIIRSLKSEIDIDFIIFFITVLDSLYIDQMDNSREGNSISSFVGVLDRLKSSAYKKEKLTVRQKYVIIAQLIYLYFKKIKIKNKNLIESALHSIFWMLIDRTDSECDYLRKINKEGGYLVFLDSKLFRSPMSATALKKTFFNIEQMYREKESLERIATFVAVTGYLHDVAVMKQPSPEKKRKKWNKQDFIDTLKKYNKNQSEMAKSYGISRQRVSELKKKFKIKEL